MAWRRRTPRSCTWLQHCNRSRPSSRHRLCLPARRGGPRSLRKVSSPACVRVVPSAECWCSPPTAWRSSKLPSWAHPCLAASLPHRLSCRQPAQALHSPPCHSQALQAPPPLPAPSPPAGPAPGLPRLKGLTSPTQLFSTVLSRNHCARDAEWQARPDGREWDTVKVGGVCAIARGRRCAGAEGKQVSTLAGR